jgi:uncharacterized protein (TIGR03067 family)
MTLCVPTTLWLLLATTPLQAEAPSKQEVDLKKELQLLQGTWQIEFQEENGEKVAAEELKTRTIAFGKNAFFKKKNNIVVQIAVMKIDPSKSPRTFNALIVQGDRKEDIMPGIYDLDGDTLKICIDTEGNQRPKEFKTAPKSGLLLIVCKRIRVKGEEEDLSGTYRAESTEIDGSKHVAEAVIERVGDAYMVTYKKAKGIAFIGIGIRKGDIFCMSWMSQGQVGVSMYQIEKGPRLVGQFTQLGGPGMFGQEVMTRMLKDI